MLTMRAYIYHPVTLRRMLLLTSSRRVLTHWPPSPFFLVSFLSSVSSPLPAYPPRTTILVPSVSVPSSVCLSAVLLSCVLQLGYISPSSTTYLLTLSMYRRKLIINRFRIGVPLHVLGVSQFLAKIASNTRIYYITFISSDSDLSALWNPHTPQFFTLFGSTLMSQAVSHVCVFLRKFNTVLRLAPFQS